MEASKNCREHRVDDHFIQRIIRQDLTNGRVKDVVLRFPPEPNGYLHIGHAKAICLNFALAKQHHGRCRLRLDDTDPTQEETIYAQAIQEDVQWLGYTWEGPIRHTSDYFPQLYEWSLRLIRMGKAYVDKHPPDAFNTTYRGTVTTPGTESPYRANSVAENLRLFEQMRMGELPEGSATLRAMIDMRATNVLLRDPVMYRVKKTTHFRTGDQWCIYPTYDFSHPLSDAIEGVTHSLCTLEFEPHRPLYNWFINALKDSLPTSVHPVQIEFSRLNLSHTLMSKRALTLLVREGVVDGWDDPRLPTLAGLRKRGYTPQAIRRFVQRVGVSKRENLIDLSLLEWCLREELNRVALRRMAVLRPIRLIITNYPKDKEEWVEAVNNPEDAEMGRRKLPFTSQLYIEQEDFMLEPSPKFFRLAVGREVRLKYAYVVRCHKAIADTTGRVAEVHCTYDPTSKSGGQHAQKRIKGTLHWVSIPHSMAAEGRLYHPLFTEELPTNLHGEQWRQNLNPRSVEILPTMQIEPALATAAPGTSYQFERQGYFSVAPARNEDGRLVFHRSVTLRDTKKASR